MKGKEIAKVVTDLIYRGKLDQALDFLRKYDLLEHNSQVIKCGSRLNYITRQKENGLVILRDFLNERDRIVDKTLKITKALEVLFVIICSKFLNRKKHFAMENLRNTG